jgi:hypothetical protein
VNTNRELSRVTRTQYWPLHRTFFKLFKVWFGDSLVLRLVSQHLQGIETHWTLAPTWISTSEAKQTTRNMARKSTETLNKEEAKEPSIGDLKRKHESTRGSRRAATKSKYFEPDTENESDGEEAPEDGSSSAVVESGDDSDISSEALSEDEQRPQKRRAPASSKAIESAPTSGSKGKELWRQGVSTGLAPGTQIIIKKPKPRTPGKTPYSDITVHPNTMLFLKDLKANNDREWLKSKCLPISCSLYISLRNQGSL